MTFYKGVDISFLQEEMDLGMRIKDFDGTEIDAFDLLKKNGVNCVRLRIWNNPENVPESKGYCSLQHTIEMAKKIREYGMDFMLDFHYSDFWADPAQQKKPLAWEKLSFEELEQAVYQYTKEVLETLKQEDLLPNVVQIGNEIRSGLLFPDGEVPNYTNMVRLINAGIRGARSAADKETMQVMIHLDQGGRYFYLDEWFSNAMQEGLADFDLIGLSYYPFWHGTFVDLKNSMEKLIEKFKKPIMIVETAHAWRLSKHGFIDEAQERIAGVKATPEGQRRVVELVMNMVCELPNAMGQGVFYWEPICMPKEGQGGWSENMGLLDEEGNVMEGMKAFSFTREDVHKEDYTKIVLPAEKKTVSLGENLLADANWDNGCNLWNVESCSEGAEYEIRPEFIDPFPAPPVNSLFIKGNKNFTFRILQEVEIEKSGFYNLYGEFKGTDTTNVQIKLYVNNGQEIKDVLVHAVEHAWSEYETGEIFCEKGHVQVGIDIVSPPVYCFVRRLKFACKK